MSLESNEEKKEIFKADCGMKPMKANKILEEMKGKEGEVNKLADNLRKINFELEKIQKLA